jgi:CRISPR-associated protein, csn1 family
LALRKRLKELLAQHGGKEKEAFAGDVYMDEAGTQGPIRSVRCFTGLDRGKMKAVKYDEQGDAVGFVSPRNNHHLAIYRTPKGKLEESIVTFWDAVDRARYGIPLVITYPREVMEQVLQRGDIPEAIQNLLPSSDWVFVDSLQQDEMVIIGLSDEELQRALEAQDYRKLSEHLYRVQAISSRDYYFRYHLETSVSDMRNSSGYIPKFYRIRSLKDYEKRNLRKVRVDLLGRISLL